MQNEELTGSAILRATVLGWVIWVALYVLLPPLETTSTWEYITQDGKTFVLAIAYILVALSTLIGTYHTVKISIQAIAKQRKNQEVDEKGYRNAVELGIKRKK